MIKKIFLGILFNLSVIALFSQSKNSYIVTGEIKTTDSVSLPNATVSFANTFYQTMTDKNGIFNLAAPNGRYLLNVSYAGYTTYSQEIIVKGSNVNLGSIIIESKSTTLREVIVSDIQKNKFAKSDASTAARMPLSNMENPTVYNMVNKDYIQELAAIDFNNAMTGIAGANTSTGVNDFGQSITMRGFTSNAGFRNGMAVNSRTQTEVYNIERIDVLKGPSGTLFGGQMNSYAGAMANYGGVVNVVTKQPFESFRGEVSYTAGSWGLNRFTADVNTPLNKNATALSRTNLLFTNQNSFQTAGINNAFGISQSLKFIVNDKTTVKFDGEIYSPKKTTMGFVRNSDILANPSMKQFENIHRKSFTSNDLANKRNAYYAMVEIEHKFNDHWISKTGYNHGVSQENEFVGLIVNYMSDSTVNRQLRPFDEFSITTDNIQQNFIGDFKLGSLRNRMVVGINYNTNIQRNQYGTFRLSNGRNSVFVPFDTIILSPDAAWRPISLGDANVLNSSRVTTSLQVNKSSSTSAYISDALNLLDNLLIMASVRIDNYKNYNTVISGVKQNDGYTQLQVSPKFGITYQPISDKLTLFANYTNGFNNIPPATNIDGTIQKFDPEQANQIEGGIKFDLLKRKLSGSVSYYNITVKNLVRTVDQNVYEQDGDLYSKGIELELITNPVKGLNIVGGFAYNDNEYKLYNKGYSNTRAPWTPKIMSNLWASYKLLSGTFKGIGAGAGFNYVDKVYLSIANKFYVPANTVFNATVFYDQPKYRIGFKVNNVGNLTYWNFYGLSQKPRELLLNVSYKF